MTATRVTRRIEHWIALAAVVCPLTLGFVPRAGHAQSPTRRDKPAERDSAFFEQRKFGTGSIPPGARQAAIARMQAQWPQTRTNRTAQTSPGRSLQLSPAGSSPSLTTYASTQSWVALGPAPINVTASLAYTGRINSIALDPTNAQTIYVGTATGGVWKTTNGGNSWAPLTDGQCLAMGSIALDPVNPQIVYAGTGEENFSADSYLGCAMLVSTNGGSTWTNTGTATIGNSYTSKVVVDKATAGSTTTTVVIAATVGGIYRSANSGATWTLEKAGAFTDLVASTTAGTYYAAYGNPGGGTANGVYKSVDDGVTWTQLSGFAPGTSAGRISLAIAATGPDVLYATVENTSSSTLLGVWKSTDGAGATWTSVTATGASCASQCWYDMYLAVSPLSSTTVFFGGFNVYKSTDGGATFPTTVTGGSTNTVHVDQHAMVFDPIRPDTMYIGNDGGIYESVDGGNTWTTLNTNLAITQFYAGVSFNPGNVSDILGGAQDNGTSEWTGSAAWTQLFGGDGAYTAFDHAGTTSYMSFTSGSFSHGVYRRDAVSPGGTFLNAGINTGDHSEWDLPLMMDPVNSSVLYYGTYRLYRSVNRGTSWATVSSTLTNGCSGCGISTIAVAPADTNTIYTGSGDGAVYVTTNLGATWTEISAGLPTRAITRVIADPLDPHTAYVTVSGYGSGHVWKTSNTGGTWTDISGNLPNAPANALVYQPGSRELDVGTDIGVFSLAFGASPSTSWTPLAAAMPNVPVIDLVYDGPNGRLIAGTHGRGMFTLATTSSVLRGNITATGTLTALDAQEILAAVVGLSIPNGSIRFPNGDANCDGNITAVDALLVLTKVAGLSTGSACVGNIK